MKYNKDKNYICPNCGEKFRLKYNYFQHVRLYCKEKKGGRAKF
jgi:uncharacterized C2H2 Zn-finger protein